MTSIVARFVVDAQTKVTKFPSFELWYAVRRTCYLFKLNIPQSRIEEEFRGFNWNYGRCFLNERYVDMYTRFRAS